MKLEMTTQKHAIFFNLINAFRNTIKTYKKPFNFDNALFNTGYQKNHPEDLERSRLAVVRYIQNAMGNDKEKAIGRSWYRIAAYEGSLHLYNEKHQTAMRDKLHKSLANSYNQLGDLYFQMHDLPRARFTSNRAMTYLNALEASGLDAPISQYQKLAARLWLLAFDFDPNADEAQIQILENGIKCHEKLARKNGAEQEKSDAIFKIAALNRRLSAHFHQDPEKQRHYQSLSKKSFDTWGIYTHERGAGHRVSAALNEKNLAIDKDLKAMKRAFRGWFNSHRFLTALFDLHAKANEMAYVSDAFSENAITIQLLQRLFTRQDAISNHLLRDLSGPHVAKLKEALATKIPVNEAGDQMVESKAYITHQLLNDLMGLSKENLLNRSAKTHSWTHFFSQKQNPFHFTSNKIQHGVDHFLNENENDISEPIFNFGRV